MKGMLEANGIRCEVVENVVTAEYTGYEASFFRVVVSDADLEAASTLLKGVL